MPARAPALLRAYAEKRDFERTAEPRPARKLRSAEELQFVVQKHHARRLHFDLRLELDGVLKSWAVAKGPSMTKGLRRLAIETEDHPMDYLEWEGVIPKGQYGGGTMIVWDRGTWVAEGDARAGLAKGKLSFQLIGERLAGRWTLVRMKSDEKKGPKNWLLIKGEDSHALDEGAPEPVGRHLKSTLTGVTNDDLAKSGALRADHKARGSQPSLDLGLAKLAGARKAILPVFVEPSLAMSAAEPPDGPEWLHEIKHDGYRTQARIDAGKVKLLTRKGLDWTKRFATVAKAMAELPVKAALIDGEIIAQDEAGHSTFSGLQSDLKNGHHHRLVYYVFDLLYCDGYDLRGVELKERRRLLAELVAASPGNFALRFSESIEVGGAAILAQACNLGLEGIVSKRADLPSVSGRGEHWMKSKCMLRQEFVVVGFVASTKIKGAIGSLALGYYEGGALVYAGRAGTGFSDAEAKALLKRLQRISMEKPAFKKKPSAASAKGITWVKPELVAEIEYRGWSSDGLLRQAAYKGIREDKPAKEVSLEVDAEQVPAKSDVVFTHPERVLWPDAGVTKQALGDFYARIADWIMPHIKGRVISLVRCPQGQEGPCFFAKHAWMGLGDKLRLVDTGDEKPMLAIDDLSGLMMLAQMNVLEIHVWGSRIADLERPDRMIFDLDPGEGVTWGEVRTAALELRRHLQSLKLESLVKTTGGKGLHVVVPLQPKAGWDEVKAFSKAFADLLAQAQPEKYLATMTKSKREGRIFIDYLRNGRGATAIAPYSTRNRPGAPVSTPLSWEELPRIESASQFTVANLEARLARLKKDPWEALPAIKQYLPK